MIGLGTDTHRLEKGAKLILGGIEIPSDTGCIAHSDGDALLHALTDALLGASALGDIGELFPDTDMKNKDADSSIFVKKALELIYDKNLAIVNIDAVIMLQKPKLSPYKKEIAANIARILNIEESQVNIKAKTGEGVGTIGRSEAVSVMCVCQLRENIK